jgi:hypothetical protein
VDLSRRDTHCSEASGQVAHERRRATNVKIAIARRVKFLECLHVEAAHGVEIDIGAISRIG